MTTRKLIEKNITNANAKNLKKWISQLDDIICEVEKYSRSYWWTPALNARTRRQNEFESDENIEIGEIKIHFESTYRESCRHCYYSKTIEFNGEYTTLTKLKTTSCVIAEALEHMQGQPSNK